ncbi:LOW QUALITY PROTEIN: hypothetical protein U9M48_012654 [Paspalum notatum var. saurae]|uniref:Uncharacterized protein n=1 Tax=Paspalum notatum var. saurae TaxID=547442 RepID=A0AAQ3WIT9_PASNO
MNFNAISKMCRLCVITKHWHGAFHKQARFYAKQQLELIHRDLCGPISPPTPRGERSFFFGGRRDSFHVRSGSKDPSYGGRPILEEIEGLDDGQRWRVAIKLHCPLCRGIAHHFSKPYGSQQNGVVESRIKTVTTTT